MEILNVYTVDRINTFGIVYLFCLAIIFLVILSSIGHEKLIIGIVITTLIATIFILACDLPMSHSERYEVFVYDAQAMSDVMEEFKIVDQRGKIFILEKINDESNN